MVLAERALEELSAVPAQVSARLDLFRAALLCPDDCLTDNLVTELAHKFSHADLEGLCADPQGLDKEVVRELLLHLGNPLALEQSYSDKEKLEPEVQAILSEAWRKAGDMERARAMLIDTPKNRANRAWRLANTALIAELGDETALRAELLILFKQSLTLEDLKAYVARFPDFDDEEAQDEALDWVEAKGSHYKACLLLIELGEKARAARVVVNRLDEVKGIMRRNYLRIADDLQDKHPLAAALLMRKFIEITVGLSNTYDYQEAALYFLGLAELDPRIDDYEGHATHSVFADYLRSEYRSSHSFWGWVVSTRVIVDVIMY